MAVHDIEPDEQWNAEARFLHGQPLHLTHVRRSDHVEQIADGAGLDRIGGIAGDDRSGHRIACGGHGELAEFLGQGHRADQGVDPAHLIMPARGGMPDNAVITLLQRRA